MHELCLHKIGPGNRTRAAKCPHRPPFTPTHLRHTFVSNRRYVTIPERAARPTPTRGCWAEVPPYEFDTSFFNFSFVSLVTRKEAIEALCRVKVECNKAAAMSLFQLPNKPLRLDEFEQGQTQQTAQTSLFLKDSWINTLKSGIRASFLDSGKGWFNIKETDFSVYQISKLKKVFPFLFFFGGTHYFLKHFMGVAGDGNFRNFGH